MPSTPMLLETIVRSFAPVSRSASMRSVGLPLSPNPPTAIVAPSWMMPARASAASARNFDMSRSLSEPIRQLASINRYHHD